MKGQDLISVYLDFHFFLMCSFRHIVYFVISPIFFALNGQLFFKEIKNEKMISFLFSDLFYITSTLSFV